jgi:HEPN domain-containing protein
MSGQLPQQWLDIAKEDLIVAQVLLDAEYFSHVCFQAQQCIEKSLKAYLIATTNQYPRIHNLVDLLTLCIADNANFSQFAAACALVDKFYIPTRYPAGIPGGWPDGPPIKKQAQQASSFASEILDYVIHQISTRDSGNTT